MDDTKNIILDLATIIIVHYITIFSKINKSRAYRPKRELRRMKVYNVPIISYHIVYGTIVGSKKCESSSSVLSFFIASQHINADARY